MLSVEGSAPANARVRYEANTPSGGVTSSTPSEKKIDSSKRRRAMRIEQTTWQTVREPSTTIAAARVLEAAATATAHKQAIAAMTYKPVMPT